MLEQGWELNTFKTFLRSPLSNFHVLASRENDSVWMIHWDKDRRLWASGRSSSHQLLFPYPLPKWDWGERISITETLCHPGWKVLRCFFFLINEFIFWLCWVFVALCGLYLAAASRSCSHGVWGLGTLASVLHSLSAGSVVTVHGLSCSTACEIFPDQGSILCSWHWQIS